MSCIKLFWTSATIKKVNDVVKLQSLIDEKRVVVTEDVIRQALHLDDADGVECLPNEEIFTKLARMGYEKPPLKLTFYKAFFSAQWKFLIHTLVQCVSAKRTVWNEFSCSMASDVICLATGFFKSGDSFICYNVGTTTPPVAEEEDKVKVPNAPSPPSPITAPSPPPQDPITTPPQAQPATSHAIPPHKQPTDTSESSMILLNTLMEHVLHCPKKLLSWNKTKLLKHQRFSSSRRGSRRGCIQTGGKIKAIDVDEDITLVDAEAQVDLGAELQGRKDDDNTAIKDSSATEPTVFNDEEVTMTMAQTLIKIKAKKARLLDEQMAKRLHDDEVEQVAAKKKQEKYDLEKVKVLQKQYVDKQENIDWNFVAEQIQEKHLGNIRKYQSIKRKPISIAQARKNMIIYLKNMARYKMEHFRGMTYDKKRVAEETPLQESFKKLKAVEVSGSHSTQDTLTNDPKEISEEDVKNMLEIVLVSEFKVEALQVKYPIIDWEIYSEGSRSYWRIIRVGGITEAYQSFEDMLKGFDREDLVALWRLVKEKFSTAVPTFDKEKALWVELTRLFKPNADDVF
uniref:Synaptobrevin, longin-like domain protein n=1 Tax=Tanacetum cinerariifolium TaxID=118510 RepID=A0A699H0D2_TANCI|nr:hypothetical protein [Tanacetum cinerariifolium]